MSKKFYLDTSAIYALSNKLDTLAKMDNVFTSILGIQEILSRVSEKPHFNRRKILINKIVESKIKFYPYLPLECIAMAFKLDISECEFIKEEKVEFHKKIKLLLKSNSYESYIEKLKDIGIDEKEFLSDLKKQKKSISKKFNERFKENRRQFKESEGKVRKIDINHILLDDSSLKKREDSYIKEFIITLLNNIKVNYTNEYINELCDNYSGELTAFFLGQSMYEFSRSYNGEFAEKNDYLDIQHLLYLRGENEVIVTNDKIFQKSTIFKQRISVEEFIKEVGIQ
ncbi:hypothetical protein ACEE25_14660 [Clostridium perfringens]|uniref:hypothetical protein n=1 Tax=Clostridium perfringens TaxID=1502 RepID=UPI000E0ADD21|nr:hypothetical protein [Clostridium perfringens]AXH53794.1 hypothetical protein C8114_14685 [Clostridium perfringens]MBI6030512.1 hypothetical protein [Clostridium perfringens]MBI6033791.1 hypothetical protein [Clostridium perfringens]MBI6066913.1 hypothetical protein [Clostridium perfringens]MBI6097062.1 hypothetical protein [Clostridium perfringens]